MPAGEAARECQWRSCVPSKRAHRTADREFGSAVVRRLPAVASHRHEPIVQRRWRRPPRTLPRVHSAISASFARFAARPIGTRSCSRRQSAGALFATMLRQPQIGALLGRGSTSHDRDQACKSGPRPHRDRQLRRHRGGGRQVLGRAGAALARQLQDRLGEAAQADRARARHRQARRGRGEHGARPARPEARQGDRRRRAGGDRGQARRALPAGRLADGLRHAVEHERQRGDLEPGDRDAGRRDGLQEAGASQRPRQHEPVVERHLSDGHAHRLRGGDRSTGCCRRCASCTRRWTPRRKPWATSSRSAARIRRMRRR